MSISHREEKEKKAENPSSLLTEVRGMTPLTFSISSMAPGKPIPDSGFAYWKQKENTVERRTRRQLYEMRTKERKGDPNLPSLGISQRISSLQHPDQSL